jgi:excisionase family DNA binding protein
MLSDVVHLPVPGPRLLEVHEVAYHLKCSQEMVWRAIRARELIAIRFGKRSWRVDPHDLQAFVDARRVRAEELEQAIAHGERDVDHQLDGTADRVRAMRPA